MQNLYIITEKLVLYLGSLYCEKVNLIQGQAKKIQRGRKVTDFVTSAIDVCVGVVNEMPLLLQPPGKRPGNHSTGGWMGSSSGLEVCWKPPSH